jgi:hypothetical protein
MPAIGACAVLACALGYGLLGWPGAAIGIISVLALFTGVEFRRTRRREREKFQAQDDRLQDQAQFSKLGD